MSRQRRAANFTFLIRTFLKEHRRKIKISTYARYIEIAESYLLPAFGKKSIALFTADDGNNFIEALSRKKKIDGQELAPKTVRDIVSLLKSALKFAERKNFIVKAPLDFKLPKQERTRIRIFTPNQRAKLEAYVLTPLNSYKFGVYLSLYTGLRLGELCALQWKDIDCASANLSVSKTILRIRNTDEADRRRTRLLIGSAKTSSSRRVIPLPQSLGDRLRQLKAECVAQDDCYVLTGMVKPIEPRNYYERYKRYLRDCGLSGFTFHTLRHTFATRCIEVGIDPKTLSEILGHASVQITLDRYVHPSPDTKRSGLARLLAAERKGALR